MSKTTASNGGQINCKSNNINTRISSHHNTDIGIDLTQRKQNFLQFLCIVGICVICYYNSIQCGLAFDDISAIRDNKDLRPSTPWKNIFLNDFWGTPIHKEQSHKSYRPLTVLTFRLNFWLHSLEPSGYHAVNVLLHIVVCLLWRRVCRLLLLHCAGPVSIIERRKLSMCSFVATILFAVHPIHTEAVTGIVGRAELLSSIFYLAAFLIYAAAVNRNGFEAVHGKATRRNNAKNNWLLYIIFVGCILASMLCKEQGITITGICCAYEIFVVQNIRPIMIWQQILQFFEERKILTPTRSLHLEKRGLMHNWNIVLIRRLVFLIGVTIALLIGRLYVMGTQLPVFTRFDNPASVAETPVRQLTYSYLLYQNVMLLLYPNYLCCDWTMGTIPLIEGVSDVRNIFTALTFLTLLGLLYRACFTKQQHHTRTLLMCFVWFILPYIPASNLFFPVGFVIAERILYMPSMGFCLLVAYGFYFVSKNIKKHPGMGQMLKVALVILICTHGIRTFLRNYDWKNDYTLFMSGVKVNPRNAKLFNNVGHALESEERYLEALEYFKQAVRIQEDDIGAHINVGRTYSNLKMYTEAEAAYLKAKALFPKIKPGESYQTRIAPNHLNVFLNLANLISKNHTRLEEADFLYRQAISMRADYVQAYINRGDILMKLNRTAQAQEVYEKALLYDSENPDIYYNLGVVLLEQGKTVQANAFFNKAIELYPQHEQALLNSAILLQEIGGAEARKLSRDRLQKVLLNDEHNEKVYFNLGMLAMDEENIDEAEQYFKRAIHIKSDFRSALFNLALLLAEANRPLDAVPYLNQLIRFHPDHIKGLILLGDIYVNHVKDLDAAEECYKSILYYEPKNVQGLHNLCVVYVERQRLAKAALCLKYVHNLAPKEDYILRHLQIVQTRLQKILKLPKTSNERIAAFADYNETEFSIHATGMNNSQQVKS